MLKNYKNKENWFLGLINNRVWLYWMKLKIIIMALALFRRLINIGIWNEILGNLPSCVRGNVQERFALWNYLMLLQVLL